MSSSFYRRIGGIPVLTRLMGHIQTTITHLFCIEKVQTFCSNQSSGCLLSKKLRPHLQILFHSKVIVKTVNKGYFLAHFQSDLVLCRGVHGSGLCLTWTRLEFFGWVKIKTETNTF